VSYSVLSSQYVGDSYVSRDSVEIFDSFNYVVKNEERYSVSYQSNAGIAFSAYQIETQEREPPQNATVVTYRNLSSSAKPHITEAIENGSSSVPYGKWNSLPRNLSNADYVDYSGSYYKIEITYADELAGVLRVERVWNTDSKATVEILSRR
jgi:hypothetical protein